MAWTEDRVARLAKLWADGLSASQIATDLGGVTRNAVIGKVHRLGLSGRAKPAGKSNGSARRKPATPRNSAGGTSQTRSPRSAPRPANNNAQRFDEDIAVKIDEEVVAELPPATKLAAPPSRKLDLLQITDSTCKWPTGDPTMPGFSFCGQPSKDDKPYCAFHNKLAFQPPNDRRRRRG